MKINDLKIIRWGELNQNCMKINLAKCSFLSSVSVGSKMKSVMRKMLSVLFLKHHLNTL